MPTNILETMYNILDTPIIAAEEDAVRNAEEFGVVDQEVGATVILQTTVGLT